MALGRVPSRKEVAGRETDTADCRGPDMRAFSHHWVGKLTSCGRCGATGPREVDRDTEKEDVWHQTSRYRRVPRAIGGGMERARSRCQRPRSISSTSTRSSARGSARLAFEQPTKGADRDALGARTPRWSVAHANRRRDAASRVPVPVEQVGQTGPTLIPAGADKQVPSQASPKPETARDQFLYDFKGGSLRSPPAPAAGGRRRPSSPARSSMLHDLASRALATTSLSPASRRRQA